MKESKNLTSHQLIQFDKEEAKDGYHLIGIDEAGRGPLCGPVVTAAVILPSIKGTSEELLKFINDSKKFAGKESLREQIYDRLLETGCFYAIDEGTIEEIDQYNIYQTTYISMKRAYDKVLQQIGDEKHKVLIDGKAIIKTIPFHVPQVGVVKGDSKSLCIAAASILAKVYRDRLMAKISKEFPQYNWQKNKGYPTKEHVEAIRTYGRCKYHRKSFKVKGLDADKVVKTYNSGYR